MSRIKVYLLIITVFLVGSYSIYLLLPGNVDAGLWLNAGQNISCNIENQCLGYDSAYVYDGECYCYKQVADCESLCSGSDVSYCYASANWCNQFPTISNGYEWSGCLDKGTSIEGCEGQYCYCLDYNRNTSEDSPVVTNDGGTFVLDSSFARLRGEVTRVGLEEPVVGFYWAKYIDEDDCGTNIACWLDPAKDGGFYELPGTNNGLEIFFHDIYGLNSSIWYHYRSYAISSYGSDWADTSYIFNDQGGTF